MRGHHSEKDVQASLKMKSRKKRHKTDQVYVVKDITFPLASLSSGYDPLEQHWQKSTLLSKSFLEFVWLVLYYNRNFIKLKNTSNSFSLSKTICQRTVLICFLKKMSKFCFDFSKIFGKFYLFGNKKLVLSSKKINSTFYQW